MSIRQSRIHRHLALPATELTFEDVDRPFTSGVGEGRDLDWKTVLPKDLGRDGGDEFAKDVTALANTSGGLLVYGVDEKQKVVGLPTTISDETLRQLEQLLLTRTAPHVTDVQMTRLTCADDSARNLLLVAVPESIDAPHVVVGVARDQKLATAMRGWERRGSDSVPLDEPALAQAYRRRLDRYTNLEERSEELRAFAAAQCEDSTETAWLIVAAVPVRPAAHPPRQERSAVGDRTARAIGAAARLGAANHEALIALQQVWENPRAGYGRWVVSNFVAPADSGAGRPCYLELHHDGAVVAAVNVSWGLAPGSDAAPVDTGVVERAVAEVAVVASDHLDSTGVESDQAFSAELIRSDTRRGPFVAIRRTLIRGEHQDAWTRPVRRAQVVRSELPAVRRDQDLALTVHDLADGVLSQFGVVTELGRPPVT